MIQPVPLTAPRGQILDSAHKASSSDGGLRINKVARAALLFTEIALATAVVSLLAVTLLNPVVLPFTALLATSIALGILLGNRVLHLVEHKLPHSLQVTINTIRGFVVDLFALVGCVFLWFIDMTRFDPKEVNKTGDANKDIPILLIHGYMHNSSGWWYTRYRLLQAGYKNIYSINLGFPTLKSIEHYSAKVDQKIQTIIAKHHFHTGNQLRLIGHSTGGVIAAHYKLIYAPRVQREVEIKNIVTLGAPLEGTYMTALAPGKCTVDMRYNKPFMQELSPKIRGYNGETQFFHIGSSSDLIIRPTKSAIVGQINAPNTKMMPDLGHLTYLFHDEISDTIINQLV